MSAMLNRGFPASYRKNTGFPSSRPTRFHRPANDNRLPNYNPGKGTFGKRGPAMVPKSSPLGPGALRGLPRGLLRRLPWVGLGLGLIELADSWLYSPPVLGAYNMAGWTQICYQAWQPNPVCIANGHPTGAGYRTEGVQVTTPGCTTTNQPPTGAYGESIIPVPGQIQTYVRTVYFGPMSTAGSPMCFSRFDPREQWTRPFADRMLPLPYTPGRGPAYIVPPNPDIWPWIDPMTQPINQPAPNPNLNKPPFKVLPYQPSFAGRGPWRQAGNGPRTAPVAPPANPRPPEPGVKERKLSPKLILGRGFVELAISAAGESAEIVNSFYDALPWYMRGDIRNAKGSDMKVFRPIPRTNAQKAGMVYDHFDKVDLTKAIKNLVANRIEDAILGKLGRIAGRASRETGINLQVGPAL